MIHVVASIHLADDKREPFLDEFRKVVPLVRDEDGCIEYGPTVDVDTSIPAQGGARPHVLTVMEKWESLDALEKHLIAPHMLEYRKTVKDFVLETTIQVLEPV